MSQYGLGSLYSRGLPSRLDSLSELGARGVGQCTLRSYAQRLESKCLSQADSTYLETSLPPGLCDLRQAELVYLFWSEFSYTLKSWRKIRGLPSRGQRTWSNAKGASPALKDFGSLKSSLRSLFYGDLLSSESAHAIGAEEVNMY